MNIILQIDIEKNYMILILLSAFVFLMSALMFRYYYKLLPSCDIKIIDANCGIKKINSLIHLSCTIKYMLDGNTHYKNVHIVNKQKNGDEKLLIIKDKLMRLNGASLCYHHIPLIKSVGYIDTEYLLPDIKIYILALIVILIPLLSVVLNDYYSVNVLDYLIN